MDACIDEAVKKVSEMLRTSNKNIIKFGLGTGKTVMKFWPALIETIKEFNATTLIVYTTSMQTKLLVKETIYKLAIEFDCRNLLIDSQEDPDTSKCPLKLIIGDIQTCGKIDLVVDGFDKVRFLDGFMLKGGGGAHVHEKHIADNSNYNIYIGAGNQKILKEKKEVVNIPLEIIPVCAKRYIELHPSSELRSNASNGQVVNTIDGNMIVDDQCPLDEVDRYEGIVCVFNGVVGTGIFKGLADMIIFESDNGIVEKYFYERRN